MTAPVTSPFSTRKTPSRVSPVSSSVCGSTSRMYQRQVSRSPRSVAATISGSVAVAVASSRIRLSTAAVAGAVVFRAQARGRIRLVSVPSLIQSTPGVAMPLSKTEADADEAPTTWNGAVSRPGAHGSLRRVSGSSASRSPMRLPPPALAKTLRPSSASRASIVQ